MELRKVIVSKLVAYPVEGSSYKKTYVPEPQGEALFHQFGVAYEELDGGPGNYTTAIVEWPDGRVESVLAEHVRFVTPNVEFSGQAAASSPRSSAGTQGYALLDKETKGE